METQPIGTARSLCAVVVTPLLALATGADQRAMLDMGVVAPAAETVQYLPLVDSGTVRLQPCRADYEYDHGRDGSVERREATYLDHRGYEFRRAIDGTMADGVVDSVIFYAHDDDGNRTRVAYDSGNDGRIDEERTLRYESGLLVEERLDEDGDGRFDEVTWYEYDAYSNLLRETVDYGADGTTDVVSRWEYDLLGRMIRFELDSNNDGALDVVISYSWHVDGPAIHRYEDDGADGTIDEVFTSTYDQSGRLVRAATDEGFDGTIEHQVDYEYNRRGLLAQQDFTEYGEWHHRHVMAYDGFDRIVHREFVSAHYAPYSETWSYTCDDVGGTSFPVHSMDSFAAISSGPSTSCLCPPTGVAAKHRILAQDPG